MLMEMEMDYSKLTLSSPLGSSVFPDMSQFMPSADLFCEDGGRDVVETWVLAQLQLINTRLDHLG